MRTETILNSADREPSPSEQWFAVQSQPFREARAAKQLELQGFQAFVPYTKKTIRHARQFRTVKRAFFPRYLFVHMDMTRTPWRSINSTFGVSRLVMIADRPAPTPRGFVEELIELTTPDGVIDVLPRLTPGQRVRILSGPFADWIGELREIDEAGRVQILLDLMGGQIPAWSKASAVVPAN